jgi:dihydroneopterin aldolase
LRQIVHQVFAERRYSLLEEVTTTIRDRIRDLGHVASAKVSITKHHPWADVPRLTLTR